MHFRYAFADNRPPKLARDRLNFGHFRHEASLNRKRRKHIHESRNRENSLAKPGITVTGRRRKTVFRACVAVHSKQPDMIFQRGAFLVPPEDTQRFRAPGGKPRRHAVAHEEIESFSGRGNGFIDRLETVGPGHLDSCDKVGNHVWRAENGSRIQNSPDPLIAPDVARFAGAEDIEKALIPDFVVGMIDPDACVLETPDLIPGSA